MYSKVYLFNGREPLVYHAIILLALDNLYSYIFYFSSAKSLDAGAKLWIDPKNLAESSMHVEWNVLGKAYSNAGEWEDAAYNGSASLKLMNLIKDNVRYAYS